MAYTVTSYITPTEAITILDQLHDKGIFASASATEQQQALNSATLTINNLDFLGDKTDELQNNEFPRNGDTTIPDAIGLATALEANLLLDGKDPETEWESDFMLSQNYAGVASRYSEEHKENTVSFLASEEALNVLKPFLVSPRDLEIDIS